MAQSELMLSAMLVVLNIFLKKITSTKPIENSTLANDISSKDRVYTWKSSTWMPIIREYTYNNTHIISLVMSALIR